MKKDKLTKKRLPKIVIYFDRSGSISDQAIKEFNLEIKKLFKKVLNSK